MYLYNIRNKNGFLLIKKKRRELSIKYNENINKN